MKVNDYVDIMNILGVEEADMMKDIELTRAYLICFGDRREFNKALNLNHLALDVGHDDMVLVYDNEFFRDRFEGYLHTNDVNTI